ncbi:OadG family protein [Shewanella sp. VB17]|nr:OadG family protein [Shewanella sp. VB17]
MDSISEQIVVSFGIMLLGMSLVFVFLMILILAIKLVAWKFAPLPVSAKAVIKDRVDVNNQDIDPKIVAAITVAIQQYRAQL